MHYFYSTHYTILLFNKIKTHLPNSILCEDLEAVMLASEDKIIVEFDQKDKIPNWVKPEQLIILSEVIDQKGTIYKFQSYLEILKEIKGQGKQIFSIVSDVFDPMFVFLLSKSISLKMPVVVCTFSLDTDTDILFDLHNSDPITLEAVETYLKKNEGEKVYELSFFKSLIDMTTPPKEMILNILSLLKEKYHLILMLMPIRNEFDLKLVSMSDHLFFVASDMTKLNAATVAQLRCFGIQGKLHEIYLSSCQDKDEDAHQYLFERYSDIVQDCI